MGTSEIRTELHELIDELDGRFLKAVHQMVSAYQSEGEKVSDDERTVLDARLKEHELNPNTGRSWKSINKL